MPDNQVDIEAKIKEQEVEAALLPLLTWLEHNKSADKKELELKLQDFSSFFMTTFSNEKLYKHCENIVDNLLAQPHFDIYQIWESGIDSIFTQGVLEQDIPYAGDISYNFFDALLLKVADNNAYQVKLRNYSLGRKEQLIEQIHQKLPIESFFSVSSIYQFPKHSSATIINSRFFTYIGAIFQEIFNSYFTDNALENKSKLKTLTQEAPLFTKLSLYLLTLNSSDLFIQREMRHSLSHTVAKQLLGQLLKEIQTPFVPAVIESKENFEYFQNNKKFKFLASSSAREFLSILERNYRFEGSDKLYDKRPSNSRLHFFEIKSLAALYEKLYHHKQIGLDDIAHSRVLLSYAFTFSPKFQRTLFDYLKEQNLSALLIEEKIYFRRAFVSPLDVYASFLTFPQSFGIAQKPTVYQFFDFFTFFIKEGMLNTEDFFKPLSLIGRIGDLHREETPKELKTYPFLLGQSLYKLKHSESQSLIKMLDLTEPQKEIVMYQIFAKTVDYQNGPEFPQLLEISHKLWDQFSLSDLTRIFNVFEKQKFLSVAKHWQPYLSQREKREFQQELSISKTINKIHKI